MPCGMCGGELDIVPNVVYKGMSICLKCEGKIRGGVEGEQ